MNPVLETEAYKDGGDEYEGVGVAIGQWPHQQIQ